MTLLSVSGYKVFSKLKLRQTARHISTDWLMRLKRVCITTIWSLAIHGRNVRCSQKLSKNSPKPLFWGFKAVQGHRCWQIWKTRYCTYAIALDNRFEALADLPDDVESAWSSVRDSFRPAAEETLGFVKPHRRPWLTSNTLEILEKKSAACRANDTAERKRLKVFSKLKLRQTARHISTDWLMRLKRVCITTIWSLHTKPPGICEGMLTQKNFPVTRKDDQACSSQQEALERWCEHYSKALNHHTAPVVTQTNATDDTTIATDAPTLSEVESAIKKLKLGRAPGGDCMHSSRDGETGSCTCCHCSSWTIQKNLDQWPCSHRVERRHYNVAVQRKGGKNWLQQLQTHIYVIRTRKSFHSRPVSKD